MKYFLLFAVLITGMFAGPDIVMSMPAKHTFDLDFIQTGGNPKRGEIEALRRCAVFIEDYSGLAASLACYPSDLPVDDSDAKTYQACIGFKTRKSAEQGRDTQSWSMWLGGQKAETAQYHIEQGFGDGLKCPSIWPNIKMAYSSFLAAHKAAAEEWAKNHAQTPEGASRAALDVHTALDAIGRDREDAMKARRRILARYYNSGKK